MKKLEKAVNNKLEKATIGKRNIDIDTINSIIFLRNKTNKLNEELKEYYSQYDNIIKKIVGK